MGALGHGTNWHRHLEGALEGRRRECAREAEMDWQLERQSRMEACFGRGSSSAKRKPPKSGEGQQRMSRG
jgi:hypothetical protein